MSFSLSHGSLERVRHQKCHHPQGSPVFPDYSGARIDQKGLRWISLALDVDVSAAADVLLTTLANNDRDGIMMVRSAAINRIPPR
ncbi:MAG TPA: hypothetical protein VIE86_02420 [Nitrososphaera sp.]|jgi:hypothetical protein